MDTFTPPVNPTIKSVAQFEPLILEAKFGDGYEQLVNVGVQPVRGKYKVEWNPITLTDRNTIEAFFTTESGVPFFYTFPDESTARRFKCKSWMRGHNVGLFTLSADFEEVFNIP